MSLKSARAALAAFNTEFDARVAVQKQVENRALREAVAQEVYALHDAGWSINKIAKEYGTQDWKTVKSILVDRPAPVLPPGQNADDLVVERDVDDWILVLAFGERVYFQDRNGYPWFNAQDKDYNSHGPLATALRDDEAFYAKVLSIIEEEDNK
jgi:hypothetical protein